MKKHTVSMLTILLTLSLFFSSSVFAEETSFWDSLVGSVSTKATEVGVEYRGHVQNKGDFPTNGSWIKGANQLGTVGEALRLEAFWIKLTDAPVNLHIQYRVHVQNKGWLDPVKDGDLGGTQGESLRIEAIEIALVDDHGNVAQGYSVEYRGHVENQGDTSWYKDGAELGTTGSGLRLEALEVRIVQTRADMTTYNAALAVVTEADYTPASWTTYQKVVTANIVTENNTQAEVDAATGNILAAQTSLVEMTHVRSVSALNSKKIAVVFSAPIKGAVAGNFSIKNESGAIVPFTLLQLNESKTEAVVTLNSELVDGGVYTVTTSSVLDAEGNGIPKSSNTFTYEKGTVANVEFTKTTIYPRADVKTLVKVTDTFGRDITEEVGIVIESSDATVISPSTGIALGSDGQTAVVVAIVGNMRTPQTMIRVTNASATSFAGANVFTGANALADTNAFIEAQNSGQTTNIVYMKNRNSDIKSLALYHYDQFANSMSATVGSPATITNLTPTIVIVNANGTIFPVSPGAGKVKVTVGSVVSEVTIEVRENPVISSIELDKKDVTIHVGNFAEPEPVNVSYRDQYGDRIDLLPIAYSDAPSIASVVITPNTVGVASYQFTGSAVITVNAPAVTVDGITSLPGLSQKINVTVLEDKAFTHYEAFVDKTDLNLYGADTATFKVGKIAADGSVVGYLQIAGSFTIEEVTAAGTPINTTDELLSLTQQNSSTSPYPPYNITHAAAKANKTGIAYVQVKKGSLVLDTFRLSIVDTTPKLTSVNFEPQGLVFENEATPKTSITQTKLDEKLASIMTFKDQFGEVFIPAPGSITSAFNITNYVNITPANKWTLLAETGSATMVVYSVQHDGKELLTTPAELLVTVSAKSAAYDAANAELEKFIDFASYDSADGIRETIINSETVKELIDLVPDGSGKTSLQQRFDTEYINLVAAATVSQTLVTTTDFSPAGGAYFSHASVDAMPRNAAGVALYDQINGTALVGEFAATYNWSIKELLNAPTNMPGDIALLPADNAVMLNIIGATGIISDGTPSQAVLNLEIVQAGIAHTLELTGSDAIKVAINN